MLKGKDDNKKKSTTLKFKVGLTNGINKISQSLKKYKDRVSHLIEMKYKRQQEKLRELELKKISQEFLTAALEITESPPNPAGHFVVYGIFSIMLIAILWSYIGKVDEVAVARGRIVPDGKIKVVQPMEGGVITSILVEEGEKVKKDQVLVELDTTIKQVDIDGLKKSKDSTFVEIELLTMILNGEDIEEKIAEYDLNLETQNNLIMLAKYRDSDFEGQKNILKLVEAQGREQVSIRETELIRMREELKSLKGREENLKILANSRGEVSIGLEAARKKVEELRVEEDIAKKLYEAGGISKSELRDIQFQLELKINELEAEKSRAELEEINRKLNWENAVSDVVNKENEIKLQELKIAQERLKHKESVSNVENSSVKKNEVVLDLLVEKEKVLADIENQISKVEKMIDLSLLKSPVDGTVHGLSANTVGGVVTLAQPVMAIVPENTPLVVEVALSNKDVGFVYVGQEVELKVDTFPYQRFGMVQGIVQSVSPDSVEDEKMGSVYKVKVSMSDPILNINGTEQKLGVGMSVTAEIKTGKRRIISFFLEPLVKNVKESVRLR